jgi:hypothetical protein
VLPEAPFDLAERLVHMDVDRQVEFVGQHRDLPERRVIDRVGRMGRETEREQWIVAQPVAQGQPLVQIIIGCAGPGARKADHDQPERGPHPQRAGGRGRRVRKEIHVVESRDPTHQHFVAGEQRPISHEVVAGHAGLGGPDAVFEPALKRQVIATTAHQRHRGVGVKIDESRGHQVAWAFDPQAIRVLRLRLLTRQHGSDSTVADHHRMPGQHRVAGGDGGDPFRENQGGAAHGPGLDHKGVKIQRFSFSHRFYPISALQRSAA